MSDDQWLLQVVYLTYYFICLIQMGFQNQGISAERHDVDVAEDILGVNSLPFFRNRIYVSYLSTMFTFIHDTS